MADRKNSPTQELSDLFYALQITTKILGGLIMEYDSGNRSQEDYESRFHSQIWVLTNAVKKIKPLLEDTIKEGYAKYVSVKADSPGETLEIN
jgi:hypothetical protein